MSGMSIWEILLLGVGLSMDAFAVSICKGLSVKKVKWQHLLCVGAYFGIFQALMPTLGYFLGTTFSNLIDQFDHWVAFILLAIIGVNMVREALSKDEDETNDDFGFQTMLLLAIATSIDALAVGVTFALEGTDIALAACLIGLTTFTLSPIGLLVGNRFGLRYKSKAELVGGLVLIGNLIRDQLLKVRDWNVGSAMSMILIALSAGIYLLYRKVGGDDLGVM